MNPKELLLDTACRLELHLTFLPLDTGSTWSFTRSSYHTPGRTDCTSGSLRINREVSAAHSCHVGREMGAAHARNVRGKYCAWEWGWTMPYLLFIYDWITCAVCNISCIASKIKSMAKSAMETWSWLIYHHFKHPVFLCWLKSWMHRTSIRTYVKFHRDAARIPHQSDIFVITNNNECMNKYLFFDCLIYTV
jgi:hypothetical protein